MPKHTAQITLNGQPVQLTADNRAKFRFQSQGGRISGLLDVDHSYLHSVRLIHALSDQATRANYPTAEDLAEHLPDQGEATEHALRAVFTLINAAGWLLTADQLSAQIAKAQAELEA